MTHNSIQNVIKIVLLALIFAIPAVSFAQEKPPLKKIFESMDSYRGPFGKNIIQGEGGRLVTPAYPPVKLFQGAFRSNKSGRLMARDYDFYVGNLFTSNYYELMEEYVFKSQYSLAVAGNDDQPDTGYYKPYRKFDDVALVANKAAALPRAATMVRHWNLERYYVSQFPDSLLARSFLRWGVASSEDEEPYAKRFFNFFMSSHDSDLQYLSGFLLLKQSTVGDSDKSKSLQTARNLVAGYPNSFKTELGRIRNAVHNQLSPGVIDMIDAYTKKNGKNSTLSKVRAILVEFYSFDIKKIINMAKKLDQKDLENVGNLIKAEEDAKRTPSMGVLFELSARATNLKKNIKNDELVPFSKKTDVLVLISYVSQYLNSKLTNDKLYTVDDVQSVESAKTILNNLYIEGLLIEKNWNYFLEKVSKSKDSGARNKLLSQSIKIGTDTIIKSFEPALAQWKEIDPKMENFVDDTVKSSALNSASVVLQRTGN